MALTGMGAGEYWGGWEVLSDRVRVHGTKRHAQERDVRLTQAPAVPRIHHRTFEDKVRERTNRAIEPCDLRRCFLAVAGVGAGAADFGARCTWGHAVADVAELYKRHEVEAYLSADAN